MMVRKDCDVIPSSSDCLFCLFLPLSSFKSSFVDWFSVYVDGVASSEKKKTDGLIILRHCYKASNLDLDMDLCHTDAFDSWPYQSN